MMGKRKTEADKRKTMVDRQETKADKRKTADRQAKRVCQQDIRVGKPKVKVLFTGIRPVKIVREMLANGLSKNEILTGLHQDYRISPDKAQLLYQVAETESIILKGTGQDMVSLYIGILE